ncbi:MAG: hypothetical protein WCO71_09690 [Pseudomonadota bacterium]
MGRPKIKEDKKRQHVNISVRPDVAALAKKADNASRLYECSVDVCKSISMVMKRFEDDKSDVNDVLEDISDLISLWDSRFDEKVEWVPRSRSTKAI